MDRTIEETSNFSSASLPGCTGGASHAFPSHMVFILLL
jgi:hypothetical protein